VVYRCAFDLFIIAVNTALLLFCYVYTKGIHTHMRTRQTSKQRNIDKDKQNAIQKVQWWTKHIDRYM